MLTAQRLLNAARIASDFTCVYCTATGTIFGTTDIYELGFSYLSISIFILNYYNSFLEKSIVLHFGEKIDSEQILSLFCRKLLKFQKKFAFWYQNKHKGSFHLLQNGSTNHNYFQIIIHYSKLLFKKYRNIIKDVLIWSPVWGF